MSHTGSISAHVRQAPHSIDSEQHVLGAVFLMNHLLDDVSEIVAEADFYRADHQLLFRTLLTMRADRMPIDSTTVVEFLRQRDELEEAGGFSYIWKLANETPSAANATVYAEAVRDRAVMRALIASGGEISELGYRSDGRTIAELVDTAQRSVMSVGERTKQSGPEDIGSLAEAYWHMIQAKKESGDVGIDTGLIVLDNMLGGLQPGNLDIIAGRPSMGKTALALNIADWVSRSVPVAIFSMEMSREEVTGRFLSAEAKLPTSVLRDPRSMTDEQSDALVWAIKNIKSRKMHVDDRGGLTALQVASKARKLHRKHRLGLIVIDYLQLMQGVGGNRNEEINDITRGLKALAKELHCPILALSQLNRSCESRDNKRPRMSDLRESGGIEQDADVIIGMYRDEYYDKASPHKGIAEAIILKQRNGATGTVELEWHGETCQFLDYTGPSFDERKPMEETKSNVRGFGRTQTARQHWQESA